MLKIPCSSCSVLFWPQIPETTDLLTVSIVLPVLPFYHLIFPSPLATPPCTFAFFLIPLKFPSQILSSLPCKYPRLPCPHSLHYPHLEKLHLLPSPCLHPCDRSHCKVMIMKFKWTCMQPDKHITYPAPFTVSLSNWISSDYFLFPQSPHDSLGGLV